LLRDASFACILFAMNHISSDLCATVVAHVVCMRLVDGDCGFSAAKSGKNLTTSFVV